MAIRGTAVTPVLQSYGQMGQIGIIMPAKRRAMFPPRTTFRGEQHVEVPVLTLPAAEETLHDMDCGSVLVFVHSEASQSRTSSLGGRSNRHQLFISFKYRRSLIHFDYFWVTLKNVVRDARRLVFHTEQKHFDVICELLNSFVHTLRMWLAAIVKTANFIDQPVESVDLRQMLRVRHHLILPRSTATFATVVLCKLDPETKKIVSTGIYFDIKARRVRDESGGTLRSFHEVFQQFLGLHLNHGHSFLPSPREEDEDEDSQIAFGILDGLEGERDPEQRLQGLLRLQGLVRKELELLRKQPLHHFDNLDLLTTLLLPHLVHSAPTGAFSASSPEPTPRTSTQTQVFAGDGYLDGPFSKTQVVIADILTDLCDFNANVVGPHIWRLCKGYLEDAINWHLTLAGLELITLMSPRFAEWLVLHTDAASWLLNMLIDSQQLLSSQRESGLALSGRSQSNQMHQLARQWPGRGTGTLPLGLETPSRSIDIRPTGSQFDLQHRQQQEERLSMFLGGFGSPTPQVDDLGDSSHDAPYACLGQGQVVLVPPSLSQRSPSFDNFPEPRVGGCQDRVESAPRRTSFTEEDERKSENSPFLAAAEFFSCASTKGGPPRPARVPPLNLKLTARPGSVSESPTSDQQTLVATSMTRSSRRLAQKDKLGSPATQSESIGSNDQAFRSSGSPSFLSSAMNSLSAPLLGLGFLRGCSIGSTGAVAVPQANPVLKVSRPLSHNSADRLALNKAEEMARALGEAALLADLSCILKYRQERMVQEAVLGAMKQPSKPTHSVGSLESLPNENVGGLGAVVTPRIKGWGLPPPPSSPAASSSSHPRGGRILQLRRVRLHTASVLSRLCGCGPKATEVLGPLVPASRLFEMLQVSSGRSGACSFSFHDDGADECSATVSSLARPGSARADALSKCRVALRLSDARFNRYLLLCDQFRLNTSSRRCVCSGSFVLKGGDDLCVCVDELLAKCIFCLLKAHAQHVEKIHARWVPDSSSNMWNVRSGIDCFVARLSRAIGQVLRQLKSAHISTTAGPEAVASMQHRLAFNLRLTSMYLRRCGGRVLSLQAFETVRPALMALKLHLCVTTDVPGTTGLSAPALRLWVAYMQLVGVFLRGSLRGGGLQSIFFVEAVLFNCVDFAPPLGSLLAITASPNSARSNQPTSCRADSPSRTGNSQRQPQVAFSSTPTSFGSQRLTKSNSLRSLGACSAPVAGMPPRLPGGSRVASTSTSMPTPTSPTAAATNAARYSQRCKVTSSSSPRNIAALLPRVLERALCDVSVEELFVASAPKPRGAASCGGCSAGSALPRTASDGGGGACPSGGKEGVESLRSRALDFVEALLEIGQLVPCPRALEGVGDSSDGAANSEANAKGLRRPAHLSSERGRTGVVGVHDMTRQKEERAASMLMHNVLEWMRFLFVPQTGLLARLGRKLPLCGNFLVSRVVQCERALFRAPAVSDAIYMKEPFIAEHYIRRHFLCFVRLYNEKKSGTDEALRQQELQLCRLHLETLLAIASLDRSSELARRVFHRLSVVDFLAGEVDLEHETSQMRDRFVRAARCPVGLRTGSEPPFSSADFSPAGTFSTPAPTRGVADDSVVPSSATGKHHCDSSSSSDFSTPRHKDSVYDSHVVAPILMPQQNITNKVVPKLTFVGIRPSTQGSLLVGAPPPEEPGIEHYVVPLIQNSAVVESRARSGVQPTSTPQPSSSDPEEVDSSDVDLVESGGILRASAVVDAFVVPPTAPEASLNSVPLTAESATNFSLISDTSLTTPHVCIGYDSPVAVTGSSVSMCPNQSSSDLNSVGVIHENVFYFQGRQRRRIYEDIDLHALMLSLILALMTTPKNGLLDLRYCSQYPVQHNKRNIPYLLSSHLNHSANRGVLPRLSQQVARISSLGCFRLFKLLCGTAMHRWMYTNGSRLAAGQFGTVYHYNVQLSQGCTVAVKQIPNQSNIQDRCVFFDVFSEIACLDAIRFEQNVCQLYDYGVDESTYWIVMKFYSTSLKKWRDSLEGTMSENLPLLLTVFGTILKAIHTLHWYGIVHYDLKCDNIMIDFEGTAGGRIGHTTSTFRRVQIGDFGESRMFSEGDDLDTRNRGTELIKCPEMLVIESFGRRDGFNFDRRRKVGTDWSADIWSLGCLLFELLTRDHLFGDDDIASFFARVTGKMDHSDGDVISESNCRKLEGNTPLIDLVRYMLQRDPKRRPSIVQVICKFEASVADAQRLAAQNAADMVERRQLFVDGGTAPTRLPHSSIEGSSLSIAERHRHARPLMCLPAAGEGEGYLTQVLKDLSVFELGDAEVGGGESGLTTQRDGFAKLRGPLLQGTWTHFVDFRAPGGVDLKQLLDVSSVLALPWSSANRSAEELLEFMPDVLDFLRIVALRRGGVLFVDGSMLPHDLVENGGSGRGGLAMVALLAVIGEAYQLPAYQALSYLSSQLLVAAIRHDAAAAVARWQATHRVAMWRRNDGLVRVGCICGACSWHLPPAWLEHWVQDRPEHQSSSEFNAIGALPAGPCTISCRCSLNISSNEETCCPCRGTCESFTWWLSARFGVQARAVTWLWLPEGEAGSRYADGPKSGTLSRGALANTELCGQHGTSPGAAACALATPSAATQRLRRYRCRSCQVLTHAEIWVAQSGQGMSTSSPSQGLLVPRTALVLTYELLRLAALHPGGPEKQHVRPPVRLHDTRLEEVILPGAQQKLRRCQSPLASSPQSLPVSALSLSLGGRAGAIAALSARD